MRLLAAAIACLLLLPVDAREGGRRVAITIDDVPRGGDGGSRTLGDVRTMTERLLRPFREQRIPVIGFVNEGRGMTFGADGLRQLLDVWLDHGADLGNHSYSHLNINRVTLEEYTADIVRGEPITRAALASRGKSLRFYRHPFLFTGPTPAIKRALQEFLDSRGYRVAPVTLDNADYQYAALYTRPQHRARVRREYLPYMESVVEFFERRSVEVAGREFAQILLLHANELNADVMPDLLGMFRRRGYTFVPLGEALADPSYRLPEEYAGPGGFSWIHRWAITRKMKPPGEPEPPAWVQENWNVNDARWEMSRAGAGDSGAVDGVASVQRLAATRAAVPRPMPCGDVRHGRRARRTYLGGRPSASTPGS